MNSITVFAEDEYFDEFSYASEWVSYDAVISVLLQTVKALEIIKDCIPGNCYIRHLPDKKIRSSSYTMMELTDCAIIHPCFAQR